MSYLLHCTSCKSSDSLNDETILCNCGNCSGKLRYRRDGQVRVAIGGLHAYAEEKDDASNDHAQRNLRDDGPSIPITYRRLPRNHPDVVYVEDADGIDEACIEDRPVGYVGDDEE